MSTFIPRLRHAVAAWLLVGLAWASSALAGPVPQGFPLAGTWTLVAADVVHADGSRSTDFGDSPKGQLTIDGQGHYSLQIYRSDRPHFASNDKAQGTDEEYKAAVLGVSAHFGTLSLDTAKGVLTFQIERASYPNWDGLAQNRQYELKGDVLSYRVPARPNGDVPVSVWRRVASP
jgi:hypothetical protein